MNEKSTTSVSGNELTPKVWMALGIAFLITVIAGWLDPKTGFPLFYAFFGGLGCLLMLFLAKGVGKKVLSRKESYYQAYENPDDEVIKHEGGHH